LAARASRRGGGKESGKGSEPPLRGHLVGEKEWESRALCEHLYRARGEVENHAKEQLGLFSDRLSTETLRANQLRLYFSSFAQVLVHALRRLAGTERATAQVDTIRLRLLKIAARVRATARRICVRYSSGHLWKHPFVAAWSALR
jgi:hypothetical protein